MAFHSVPFQVTQQYPLYSDSEGILQLEIRNLSDDVLLFKIMTARSMVIFTILPKRIEKVVATYKPPISDSNPKMAIQAIIIGDQDETIYTQFPETRQKAWDSKLSMAKENNIYYELQIPLIINIGAKPHIGPNEQNVTLRLKNELEQLMTLTAKTEADNQRLENDIFTSQQIVCRDSEIIKMADLKISDIKQTHKIHKSLGKLKYSHILSVLCLCVGVLIGIQLKTKK